MIRHFRTIPLTLALLLVAVLVALAAALVALTLQITRLARYALGDRLTGHGNRLYRLGQRLSDALERLDAAIGICLRG